MNYFWLWIWLVLAVAGLIHKAVKWTIESVKRDRQLVEDMVHDLRVPLPPGEVVITAAPLSDSAYMEVRSRIGSDTSAVLTSRPELIFNPNSEQVREARIFMENPRIDRRILASIIETHHPGLSCIGIDRDIRTREYIIYLSNGVRFPLRYEQLEHQRPPLGPAPAWAAESVEHEPTPVLLPERNGRLWRAELKKNAPTVEPQKITPNTPRRRSKISRRGSPP